MPIPSSINYHYQSLGYYDASRSRTKTMNWSELWSTLKKRLHCASGLESSFCSTACTSCLTQGSRMSRYDHRAKVSHIMPFSFAESFNQIHLSKYSEFWWDPLLMDISYLPVFVCCILVIHGNRSQTIDICLSTFWPSRMWKNSFPIHCRGPKPVPQPRKSGGINWSWDRYHMEHGIYVFLWKKQYHAKLQMRTTSTINTQQVMGTHII